MFAKQWRLILVLSKLNANISSYVTEPSTVASVLERYDPQELQCSVVILGAFHQVNLKGEPKVLSFAAGGQNFAHSKLPMGNVNSVNILQSILNVCFKSLGKGLHPWFLTYVDDIILPTKTVDEILWRLTEFIKLCKLHYVVLKKSKSNLLRKDDISLLGFPVSKGKLRPAEKKINQIQLSLEKLRTQKDLRALL
jgi:hypothetical protein